MTGRSRPVIPDAASAPPGSTLRPPQDGSAPSTPVPNSPPGPARGAQGEIPQPSKTQARFRKLPEKVEVTVRWHDLRHVAVSLWIGQGFTIREVMTFASNSSILMTKELYGPPFPTPDHRKAMAMVEAKLLG